jgi:putative tryptophan/tyrosine transport system substrate-binding protein
MRSRYFYCSLIVTAVALLIPVRAETPSSLPRIAFVHSGIPTDQFTVVSGVPWIREFFQELRRIGYTDAQNLIVDRYSAEGHLDRFPELARKIVASNPVVILSNGPLVNALRAATTTIPVLAIMGDPIREGVASNLAAPPANISGVSVDAGAELYGKQLQILKEAVPAASTVAYLSSQTDWDTALGGAVRDAGERLGVSVVGMPLKEANPPQLRETFAAMAQQRLKE